jgi:hypothetical protein
MSVRYWVWTQKKGLHGRYGIFCFKGLPILYDARRVWACMGSTGYQYVMCVIQPSHFLLLGLLDTAAFCWQNIPAVISQRGCNKRHLKLGLLKCGSRPAVHHTFVGWTSNFHPILYPPKWCSPGSQATHSTVEHPMSHVTGPSAQPGRVRLGIWFATFRSSRLGEIWQRGWWLGIEIWQYELMIWDDLPTKNGNFTIVMWVYQRVSGWLVVTGTMEFYDFPFSWECHHPNWRTHIRGVGIPPTSDDLKWFKQTIGEVAGIIQPPMWF